MKMKIKDLIIKINQNEKKIDQYEILVSDKFINAIVLYQPVASDIRKLVAVYRMIINLERIGDLVMNISYTIDILRDSAEYKAMSGVILNMLTVREDDGRKITAFICQQRSGLCHMDN